MVVGRGILGQNRQVEGSGNVVNPKTTKLANSETCTNVCQSSMVEA